MSLFTLFYFVCIRAFGVLTGTKSFCTSSTARCSLTRARFSVSSTVIKTWRSSAKCSQFGFPRFASSYVNQLVHVCLKFQITKRTFFLSRIDPLPLTIILQPVSCSNCLAVIPRGPRIRPTKLNWKIEIFEFQRLFWTSFAGLFPVNNSSVCFSIHWISLF